MELDPQLTEIQQQLLAGRRRADGQLGGAAQSQLAQEAPTQYGTQGVLYRAVGQAEVELARPALLQALPRPLEHARYREEEGRLHLRQIALRLPEIVQEVDVQRLGDVVAGVRDQDAFDDMVQGQKGQVAGAPRARSPGQERRHGLTHPAQAAVPEHHALGPAGGARGVAQRRQVAETGGRLRLGIEWLPAAQCQERLPGHDGPRAGRSRCRRRGIAAEGNDRGIRVQLAEALEHPVEAHEKQARAAGRQDVIDIGRRARVVQRDADRAQHANGHVKRQVARAVRPGDRHGVARTRRPDSLRPPSPPERPGAPPAPSGSQFRSRGYRDR